MGTASKLTSGIKQPGPPHSPAQPELQTFVKAKGALLPEFYTDGRKAKSGPIIRAGHGNTRKPLPVHFKPVFERIAVRQGFGLTGCMGRKLAAARTGGKVSIRHSVADGGDRSADPNLPRHAFPVIEQGSLARRQQFLPFGAPIIGIKDESVPAPFPDKHRPNVRHPMLINGGKLRRVKISGFRCCRFPQPVSKKIKRIFCRQTCVSAHDFSAYNYALGDDPVKEESAV